MYTDYTKFSFGVFWLIAMISIASAQLFNPASYQRFMGATGDQYTSGSILQAAPWGGGVQRSDGTAMTNYYANYNSYNNNRRVAVESFVIQLIGFIIPVVFSAYQQYYQRYYSQQQAQLPAGYFGKR